MSIVNGDLGTIKKGFQDPLDKLPCRVSANKMQKTHADVAYFYKSSAKHLPGEQTSNKRRNVEKINLI